MMCGKNDRKELYLPLLSFMKNTELRLAAFPEEIKKLVWHFSDYFRQKSYFLAL